MEVPNGKPREHHRAALEPVVVGHDRQPRGHRGARGKVERVESGFQPLVVGPWIGVFADEVGRSAIRWYTAHELRRIAELDEERIAEPEGWRWIFWARTAPHDPYRGKLRVVGLRQVPIDAVTAPTSTHLSVLPWRPVGGVR